MKQFQSTLFGHCHPQSLSYFKPHLYPYQRSIDLPVILVHSRLTSTNEQKGRCLHSTVINSPNTVQHKTRASLSSPQIPFTNNCRSHPPRRTDACPHFHTNAAVYHIYAEEPMKTLPPIPSDLRCIYSRWSTSPCPLHQFLWLWLQWWSDYTQRPYETSTISASISDMSLLLFLDQHLLPDDINPTWWREFLGDKEFLCAYWHTRQNSWHLSAQP